MAYKESYLNPSCIETMIIRPPAQVSAKNKVLLDLVRLR